MRIPKLSVVLATAAVGAAALGAIPAIGADHKDAPLTKTNAQADINDVYLFKNAAGYAVYLMTVNPLTSPADTANLRLSTDTVYEIKQDTNGDAVADAALKFTFSGTGAVQDVTVRLATGAAATANDPAGTTIAQGKTSTGENVTTFKSTDGKYTFYVGPRDDPFFFDLAAFNKGLAFTNPGVDTFKGTNVTVIAVEENQAPASTKLGIWGTTGRLNNVANYTQFDRMGRPAILTVFIPTLEYLSDTSPSQEDAFNATSPDRDVAIFKDTVVATLTKLQSNPALADVLLPDILTIDFAQPVKYLNGRGLSDDVIDISLQVITGNMAASDNVGANDAAFLSTFPYAAAPWLAAATTPPAATPGTTPRAPAPPNTGSGVVDDGSNAGDYTLPAGLIAGAVLLAGAVYVARRRQGVEA